MNIPALPPFLQSEFPPASAEDARFHVIPAGFERSVSYGGGTADGPRAILEASQQLEGFDGISEPGSLGIFTSSTVDINESTERVLAQIETAVYRAIQQGSTPVLLGGEHTVSVGAFRALARLKRPVGVVQFDAHADLRDTYQGSPLSHACVMRRALELGLPICQLAVRSLSIPEDQCRKVNADQVVYADARDLHRKGLAALELPKSFPQELYITFDVDALDPSLMPATGTPEPGGLLWHETLDAIEHVLRDRQLIGFDVVEFAPKKSLHHPDFTAARLVYDLMGYAARSHVNECGHIPSD